MLQFVISDGCATSVVIVKDPGKGLGIEAVESVRSRKFKPAAGPDGRPVAVTGPVEVTFRFY